MRKNKIKKLIIFLITIAYPFLCFAQIDKNLEKNAEVILRVHYSGQEYACDKYCWQPVKIIKVLKNSKNYSFPENLEIAYYSWEKGIPLGESTVYLEKYNSYKEGTWKLVGGKHETGVSHNQTKVFIEKADEEAKSILNEFNESDLSEKFGGPFAVEDYKKSIREETEETILIMYELQKPIGLRGHPQHFAIRINKKTLEINIFKGR